MVTSQINYLTGLPAIPRKSRFPRLSLREKVRSVDVYRAYTPSILHQSFIHRVIAFVVFAISSVIVSFRVRRVDVVLGTSPPIFQAWSAWLAATIKRKPFVLEVRDLWPEFAIDMGVLQDKKLIWLSRRLEAFLYRHADHIIVNSPAFETYLGGHGVAPAKVTLIANGVDVNMFDPAATGIALRTKFGLGEKIVVMYAGAIGPANNLDSLISAATQLRGRTEIAFLIAGDGKDRARLEAKVKDAGLTNVVFAGALPKSEMPEVIAAADICVAMLKDIPMFRTTYPNKVFDYMAAGRPTVLAIGGVIADVLSAGEGGIVVHPGSSDELAAAITTLADDPIRRRKMGDSARAYVAANFNRDVQAEEFRACLAAIANPAR